MSLVHGVEQLPGFVMSHVAEISECFSPKDTSLVCGGFFDSLPIELCWFEETTGADRDTLDGLPGDRSEMLLLVSVSWKDFGRQAGLKSRSDDEFERSSDTSVSDFANDFGRPGLTEFTF